MVAVNWTNITDLNQIPALANTVSHDTFWVGMLMMLWVVLTLMFISYGFEVALLVSSFLGFLLSLLLAYSGLLAWKWVLVFVGVMLALFLYIIWSSTKVRTT